MNITPIKSDSDYRDALRDIETLMGAEQGSADGDRLDVLVTLVEAWERRYHPLPPPDPIEAIRFCMEQRGLAVQDLEPYIGRLNRVYEILQRTRPLSLAMIRRLHDGLGIPLESLVRPIAIRKRAA